MDLGTVHKQAPLIYRQFENRTEEVCQNLCYDGIVWKRLAIRQGAEFVRHVVPAVFKPIHILWNEVIGFLFLSLAVIIGLRTARGIARHDDLFLISFGALGTVLMLWYGISSFRKARKISRS